MKDREIFFKEKVQSLTKFVFLKLPSNIMVVSRMDLVIISTGFSTMTILKNDLLNFLPFSFNRERSH